MMLIKECFHFVLEQKNSIIVKGKFEGHFIKSLGLDPKELMGINFTTFFRSYIIVTNITAKYGYFDQPHFINNFRCLHAMFPNQVFRH